MKSSHSTRLLQDVLPRRSEAPVDLSYAEQGYAYLLEQEPGLIGECTYILKSKASADRYYACAYQVNRNASTFASGVWALNGNGKRDSAFTVDFPSYTSHTAHFTPRSLIEDTAGKLLCLGSVSTGQSWLWRFNDNGTPDITFGNEGHISSDKLLPEPVALRYVAPLADGYVLACEGPERRTLLLALAKDGTLDTNFGKEGILELDQVLPGDGIGVASLVVAPHTDGSERVLLLTWRNENANEYSVFSCITSTGVVDSAFANQGHFRSEVGTYYVGTSVSEQTGSLITLCGGHLFEDGSLQPEISRLTLRGVPTSAFNGGKPVRFDAAGGMWHHIIEIGDRLVGIGSFYTHNKAVRYYLGGTLDTSFVPPLGYGQFGATVPNPGFYLSPDASIAFVPAHNRMLVCGDRNNAELTQTIPVVHAISLG
ncbi:hypothetical protein QUC26_07000 [Pseudomonas asiatica]|uniref:hypothetical protein n=1 Tax=Pseudomonas asiatica TaxID=2219225 RepID=UPI00259FF2B4|nr:hypothetical protein [Pseudomonas asiatica]WJM54908.1 hypothetical protein QUC26_07000 [Pseudomonas asiatica]